MSDLNPFHLAIPVYNLEECRSFYNSILGFEEGRSSKEWVDFNCFGHQLVIHKKPQHLFDENHANSVDGKHVPVPHFGVILKWDEFTQFEQQLKSHSIDFIIEPYLRFEGETGEQKTMFFTDPSGNALEFKTFKNTNQIFKK
ncbi:MAG: glyoxalase [Bacteroidetes bacterium MedPE-SWsnd-G2]|nr:MAG: glyoxalase [Bacteroidetes bacterium MedPE-SWsnd-G2]